MPTHRVGRDDDLWSLADRYYGDRSAWRLIFDANRGVLQDENTPLKPGLLLIIPLNAEDAADWSDLTDDEYGIDRGPRPKRRIDFADDPDEAMQRLGLGELIMPAAGRGRRYKLIRAGGCLVLMILALTIMHLCGAFNLVPRQLSGPECRATPSLVPAPSSPAPSPSNGSRTRS